MLGKVAQLTIRAPPIQAIFCMLRFLLPSQIPILYSLVIADTSRPGASATERHDLPITARGRAHSRLTGARMCVAMPKRWQQVRVWRDRAEKLRTLADSFPVPLAKDGLQDSARNYDRMADDLERELRREGLAPPPGA